MDKTNYSLLGIVAAVALAAIVGMFLNAQNNPSASASPSLVFLDGFSSGPTLTGNVISEDRMERLPATPLAAQRARPDLDFATYDYNNDGKLTARDTDILVEVVARARFCPAEKVCDVNSDRIVDDVDRRTFDATILRLESEQMEARELLTGTPSPAPASDPGFWMAVTGAPSS